MTESVSTLYSEKRFERILYYLKERGFLTLDSLLNFDFNELMFVPGVSNDQIIEAKQLLNLNKIHTKTTSDNTITIKTIYEDPSEADQNIIIDDNNSRSDDENISHQANVAFDSLIADVYFCVPRSKPFVKECTMNDKLLMSQLTESDFENAKSIKGLGVASVENLKKVYFDHINFTSKSENNLINNETLFFPSLIDHLPLSVRARNCLKHSGVSTLEELLILSQDDLMNIRNMGVKTFNEILSFRDTISIPVIDLSKRCHLEDINFENLPLPLSLLCNIGISKKELDQLHKNNLFTVRDLLSRGLTPQEYSTLRNIEGYLTVPVSRQFIEAIDSLKDSAKICLSRRCNGSTLEEIGTELLLSRERVRQILAKTCRKLMNIADLIAGVLLSSDKDSFTFSDLTKLFRSEESAMYCKLVLQESENLRYIKFSDKFIRRSASDGEIEKRVKEYIDEVIGEGINFYDNLELIDSELKKYNLDFLDVFDIMNYLVYNKYRFYGDYVTKGASRYSIICYDVVCKFFKFDIKLDSEENNKDMLILRQIIAKHYHGLALPPNNRALTAGMTRDFSKLILSGRGRYCPIEKIVYSASLFEEIHDFIKDGSQISFYYSELFSHFKGRLLAETNINNPNFLHGMLKYLYANEFSFERDMLSKIGGIRQDINDRMIKLILETGHAVTKAEIKKSIPGVNDYVIAFSVMRFPEIIQWDYNEYNHIQNIKMTDQERIELYDVITIQTEIHKGYTSDVLLFNAIRTTSENFLSRNNIRNSLNLYYVVSYLFRSYYRFKRPHILSMEFPVEEISAANIVQVLLNCESNLNFEKFNLLAGELGWSGGTLYSIFSELEKDFVRVSESDYVRRKYFGISQSLIDSISQVLKEFINDSGYFAFNSIFNYEAFPKCSYKWNGFLLETLITEFDTGYRIISPQIRDRRYQRGIIVANESLVDSFEDLVVKNLLSDGISTLSETELLKYLKMHGLISTNSIPQEMYECPDLLFKNEVFTVRRQ
jgi:hypothetical protein